MVKFKSGFSGAAALVFSRLHAEYGENAITANLQDSATVAKNNLLEGTVQRIEQLCELLRINGRSERRRVAEIRKQSSQMSALRTPSVVSFAVHPSRWRNSLLDCKLTKLRLGTEMQEAIVLAIHGMGDTPEDFAADIAERLEVRLGSAWSRVYFDSIYYQGVFQGNQERVMEAMSEAPLDSLALRRFVLYGFSDATGLEREAEKANRPYQQVQDVIRTTLKRAYEFLGGPRPVVLIAQSLGCQVMSNYLWDAQKRAPRRGVWRTPRTRRGTKLDDFLRLKYLRYFYTTGCNIPIFLAGFPEENIRAVKVDSSGYAFRWKNFYDADDVLGWPLRPLSSSYANAVHTDAEVNAGGSLLGHLTHSWNTLSHLRYWQDDEVLKPLEADIKSLLP